MALSIVTTRHRRGVVFWHFAVGMVVDWRGNRPRRLWRTYRLTSSFIGRLIVFGYYLGAAGITFSGRLRHFVWDLGYGGQGRRGGRSLDLGGRLLIGVLRSRCCCGSPPMRSRRTMTVPGFAAVKSMAHPTRRVAASAPRFRALRTSGASVSRQLQ